MKKIFTLLFLTVFLNVRAQGDLSISLYSASIFFDTAPGDTVTLIASYSWTGTTDAPDVVVNCELPPELQFINAFIEPTSQTASMLSWQLGTLSANQGGTIFIICVIDPNAVIGVPIRITADISGAVAEANPDNNIAVLELNVSAPIPDLVMFVWASFEEMDFLTFAAEQNVPFSFDIYFFNLTNFTAPNTVIYDTIPENCQFVSAVPEPTSING